MKYRSRLEIISTMLHFARDGAAKTRLMYGVYLSYAQVNGYLKFLMEKGLLSYEEITHQYRTTDKGLRFLKIADEAEQILGADMDAEGNEGRTVSVH